MLEEIERRAKAQTILLKGIFTLRCGVEQWLARQPHKLKVVGSSPTSRYHGFQFNL